MMKFLDLNPQYLRLEKSINERIKKVLEHGQYINGPEVTELEELLTDYLGIKHAITCANGTDALSIALKVLQVNQNDAIFCPTFSYIATAEVIALEGAMPIFVDSDPRTFNICAKDLEKKIKQTLEENKKTPKAIITVDLFGLPADYYEIKKVADKYKLKIIEDGAQGFGGEINGRKACTFGDISTTSFFPSKPLGCYGDGGAIFTDRDDYAEVIRSLKVHGKGKDKYHNIRIGMNSRLDSIQAAILIEKLSIFDEECIKRNDLASIYNKKYSSDYVTPFIPSKYKSSYAQYTLLTENRDKAINKFNLDGIPTMVYYPVCIHRQHAFSYLKQEHACPVAENLSEQVLSLPMNSYFET